MKITNIRTTMIVTPVDKPHLDATVLKGSNGRSTCFVHIDTDEGIEGFGWAAGNRGIQAVIETTLKSALIGTDPLFIEKRWWEMFWSVRGVGRKGVAFCAISSVDIALWDLRAKYFKVPLYQLLGPYTDTVPIYGSGGWTSFTEEELVREQMGYVEQGIPRVKMKVGKDFGQSEREDVKRLAAVRKAVGDDVEIYIDANNGYYAKQAIYMAREFEQFNVGWFEEPVLADDIDGLAQVAAATTIPVATGEHEYTKYGFKDLIARGGVDIVQPDVGRVGGVTEWMKVAHLAHAFNLPVAPHGVQAIHLHLACATPNLKVVECLGTIDEADKLLFLDFPKQKNGMWSPYKDRPGLGLELNPDTVKKFAV
jgi:L-alanine-DL-glutamate epimerase-like enolase superfamily enzyme